MMVFPNEEGRALTRPTSRHNLNATTRTTRRRRDDSTS